MKWAEAAGGALRVALVARPELINAQKIGVLMAQNRGVNGDVFAHEADALAWLDARIQEFSERSISLVAPSVRHDAL